MTSGNHISNRTLSELCSTIIDSEHKTAPVQTEGHPYIRTPNIGRGRLDLNNAFRISDITYKDWTRRATPQHLDLILAREAPVGNVAIVPKNVSIALGQRTVLLRPNPEVVSPHFLCYKLLSASVQNTLYGIASGSTVPHLNLSDLRKLELFNLPPLPTQKKIASILSAYDDLIENNERRIKILEEMAQSIYREWFVHFRFPGHENVKMVESELGLIPEGWEVTQLGNLISIDRGLSYSGKFLSTDITGTPLINLDCILRGGGFKQDGLKWYTGPFKVQHTVHSGDLLITNTDLTQSGTVIGNPAIVPNLADHTEYAYSHHLYAVRPSEKIRDFRQYLYHFLNSWFYKGFAKGYSNGTTVLMLPRDGVLKCPISLPPSKVLEPFETMAISHYKLINDLIHSNQILRQTRDLLLPKLISGQIDVEDLDIKVA